jgi:hypothetical protein
MAASFEDALARAQSWVGTVEGVVAVGEGRDEQGRRSVDVWATAAATSGQIPDEIDGVPVRVRASGGDISAQ